MGNAGSNMPRERHKSSSTDITPGSPGMKDGQAFVFEKKKVTHPGPPEDDEPYYTKTVKSIDPEFVTEFRQRANTTSEDPRDSGEEELDENGEKKKPALPTVFKWDGGGRQVYISGTFSDWQTVPMVRSHGDFVTIIDLPEGDHQYKFLVDGEWKHDPKLVRMIPCLRSGWLSHKFLGLLCRKISTTTSGTRTTSCPFVSRTLRCSRRWPRTARRVGTMSRRNTLK